ncbi:MAG TPA: histidine phosphatase family protein [Candidatus Nitrosotalea sp.]|nr:histidine phosphatase family protein [Candidatus Nitrosotalea sp.]
MIKTIYIIRHGEVDTHYDHLGRRLIHPPDAELGEKGKKQMDEKAKQFQKYFISLDAIYSSPSIRAAQSAKILSEKLDTPSSIILKGLKDIIDASNKLNFCTLA